MLDYKSVIVDGELISGHIYGEFGECSDFELLMRETGYPLAPKLNGYGCKEDPSITKQDLIDHPDWFEPYKFPFIVIKSWGGDWKYEECIEAFRYKDGKWVWDRSKSPDPCVVVGNQANTSEIMAQDVAYMKQWYPELYKKVLELNELQEDDSGNLIPAVPQQGKSHTSKPTAPGAKKSNTAGQTPVITRMNKPDSVPQPDGLKSPVITVPTNDDVMQMAGTLSAAMKARMFTMSSRDEMTKFAEELAGVLQEECVSAGFIVAGEEVELVALIEMLLREGEPVGADGDVEINYTYISESLDFNNIAAAI